MLTQPFRKTRLPKGDEQNDILRISTKRFSSFSKERKKTYDRFLAGKKQNKNASSR